MAQDSYPEDDSHDFDLENEWFTFKAVRQDVSETLTKRMILGNFTAHGVQIIPLKKSIRLYVHMTPGFSREGLSYIGRVNLTDDDCEANLIRVARLADPASKWPHCAYQVRENKFVSGPFDPYEVHGVFSNGIAFIDGYAAMQRSINSQKPKEEDDLELDVHLPSASMDEALESTPNSWAVHSQLYDIRGRLEASVRELLEFDPYTSEFYK